MYRVSRVTFTTTSGGAATVYSDPCVGVLHGIFYDYGDGDTGADFTITDDQSGLALLTVTNAGTADALYLPRGATASTANAASLYAAGGTAVNDRLPLFSRVKIVVAQGGNAKSGTFYVLWDDGR